MGICRVANGAGFDAIMSMLELGLDVLGMSGLPRSFHRVGSGLRTLLSAGQ